jgi:hypothetical protein
LRRWDADCIRGFASFLLLLLLLRLLLQVWQLVPAV